MRRFDPDAIQSTIRNHFETSFVYFPPSSQEITIEMRSAEG